MVHMVPVNECKSAKFFRLTSRLSNDPNVALGDVYTTSDVVSGEDELLL